MSGKIPQSFINELLERADIVDIIGQRVKLTKKGNSFVACCPFHSEKTPSFNVSQSKQLYHCFGCGASGNSIKFLMDYDRLEFLEVIEELATSLGLDVPVKQSQNASPQQQNEQKQGLAMLRCAEQYFAEALRTHPKATTAIDYLMRRGLDGATCKHFNIGFAPESWDGLKQKLAAHRFPPQAAVKYGLLSEKNGKFYDRFRGRIIFPIKNRKGDTIGFGGRVLGEGEPKYLNSPETPVFHKNQELYGLYHAKASGQKLDFLVVVEGYLDVIALSQAGIHKAVATMGTACSANHIRQLFRYTNKIVFCFDGDNAGRKAAWKAMEQTLGFIRDEREVGFLFLDQDEDPDSFVRKPGGADAFMDLASNALPLADYLMQNLTQTAPPTTIDGKRRFMSMAKPLLEQVSDPVYHELLTNALAKKAGLENDELNQVQKKPATSTEFTAIKTLSPLSQAIALSLQYPEKLRNLDWDRSRINQIRVPGIQVLGKLLEIISVHPHITTAQLLAQWPEDATARRLEELAHWQRPGSEVTIHNEFLDCIERIQRESRDRRIANLQQMAAERELSQAEKNELNSLLYPSKH